MVDIAIFYLFSAGVAALLSVPAWYFGYRHSTWSAIDFVSVFLPPALWLAIGLRGVGAQSLGNLMELGLLSLLIPVAISLKIRFSILWPTKTRRLSWSTFAFLCLSVIAFRMFTPSLPE
jgi:hypothetical protein